MEDPYHYRNKVHAVFDIAKGGKIISGVYKAGTHDVVNIDSCQIEDGLSDAIIRDIRGLCAPSGLKPTTRIPVTAYCAMCLCAADLRVVR